MTSIIKVDQIQTAAGGVPTAADLGLNVSGAVLQVVSTNDNNQTAATTTSFLHFSSLETRITPKSATSKIFVTVNIHIGNANDDNYNQFNIYRLINGANGVNLGLGQPVGGATTCAWSHNGPFTHAIYEVKSSGWSYLDSPSTTDEVTYQLWGRAMASTNRTMYLNRPHDVSDGNRAATSSTMTLIEIAG